MKNKDIIYIFVILVIFFYFKNEILNLKKIEKLNNTNDSHSIDISKIQQVIQGKYQIDMEAIRNLSDVSKELQNGGLTIPGDLTIKGKLTVEKDSVTNGNSNVNGDLVFGGGNNWILHTPDDGRHTLHVAPSKEYGKTDWDWKKQATLDQGGNLSVSGHSTINGNSNVNGDLVFGGGNNWIFHTPDDNTRTLFVTPSKEYGKTDWDWDKGTDFLNTGGIEVVKFRPKVGKHCGMLWDSKNVAVKSKEVFEKASADWGDIVPTIYHRGDCKDHWHRGGFMSKSKKWDGDIVGTYTDLQDGFGELLWKNDRDKWLWKKKYS